MGLSALVKERQASSRLGENFTQFFPHPASNGDGGKIDKREERVRGAVFHPTPLRKEVKSYGAE